jgi:signal transduction histidine kinase
MIALEESLARACHELRGPLHAAGLALHAAARETPAAATRLRAVQVELGRAAAVIEDLDALRLGRSGTPGSAACCEDVGLLVRDQVLTWSVVAAEHGRVLVPGPVATGIGVGADPRRIAQATGNLVANALEHGAGTVTVSVTTARGRVRIVIDDEGSGLGQSPGPLRPARARPGAGRGHGLRITADLARAAGGRLLVLPCATGARVALELPLADRSA